MRIHEDVITKASPERAWELLSDPELHELWRFGELAEEGMTPESPPGAALRAA